MAVLKIVPGGYMNLDALEKLIDYVFHKALLTGGYGVNPLHAAEQMHIVKQYWDQTQGKQLRHFVVSFNDRESKAIYRADDLMIGAYQVCQSYYEEGYQCVFGVHRSADGSGWHIHFVVNNTNLMTGRRLSESNRMDYQLKYVIQASLLPTQWIQICYD